MNKFIIGMQISFPLELIDEGIENSLNEMKKRGINTIFILTNIDYQDSSYWGELTHNPKRKKIISSGFFYEPRSEYYKNTKIKPIKTNDPILKNIDILNEVIKLAHREDIKCYAFILNRIPFSEKHWDCFIRDVLNHPIPNVFCFNNPDVRNLYYGMIADLIENYNLDGIFLDLLNHSVQYGFKKLPDELVEIVGSIEIEKAEMGLTCFCEHCKKIAKERNIDIYKIKKGLIQGVKLGLIPEKVQKLSTVDEVMDLLIEVPEYFEWLRFKAECLSEFHAELYGLAKSLNRKVEVALDIYGPSESWKYASDFHSLSRHCDWIKPMFYSGTYPALPLTPEKIYSEVKKAIEKVNGRVDIVAGINAIGVSPKYVKESVVQSLKAGSKGVIISWDYGLIPFENMDAAKEGILEVKEKIKDF